MLRLFGHKPTNNNPQPCTTFKTTSPTQQLTYEQWVKEFNVSMMWDRKAVYINNQ